MKRTLSLSIALATLKICVLLAGFAHSFPSLDKRNIINKDLTYKECESTTSSGLSSGIDVFAKGSQPNNIQSLMVTGWIFPKGYRDDFHTIFSISHVTEQRIYLLAYKPTTKQIHHDLKGSINDCTYPSAIINRWFFYKVRIQLASTPTEHQVDFIHYPSTGCSHNLSFTYSSGGTSVLSEFVAGDLFFNFGDTNDQLEKSSCALVKDMIIYLNDQPISDDMPTSIYHKKFASFANLRSHYDFFYTKANHNKLFSFNSFYKNITASSLIENSLGNIEVQNSAQLCLDRLYYQKNKGFIISFEFKVILDRTLFQIKDLSGAEVFKLHIEGSQLNTVTSLSDMAQHIFTPSQVGTWCSIVMIVTINLNIAFPFIQFYAQIQGNIITFQNLSFTIPQGSQPCFGDSYYPTEFDHIRIYDGSMVIETDTCYFQTEGDEINCLMCKPPKILVYQGGMKCQDILPYYTNSRNSQVADWTRQDCLPGMMHLTYDQDCYCQYQQYRAADDTCKNCPHFCSGCYDKDKCLAVIDTYRIEENGTCFDGALFDDGINCIDRSFSIPDRVNFYSAILNGGVEFLFIDRFKISPSTPSMDPFFVTATYNTITDVGMFSKCVFYFIHNGIELVTVLLRRTTPSDLPMFTFYYSSDSTDFYLNPLYPASLALWFHKDKIIFAVQSNGQTKFKSYSATFIAATTYSYPNICIGACTTSQSFTPPPIPYDLPDSKNFVKFYRGMKEPPDTLISDMLNLMCDPGVFIADFTFYWDINTHIPPLSLDVYTPSISTWLTQTLDVSAAITHLYKGVAYQSISPAAFSSLSTEQELSISLNIYIDRLEEDYKFIQYQISATLNIFYKLMMDPSENRAILVVCVVEFDQCVQLRDCSIYYNAPNFLAIIVRFARLVAGTKSHLEIEAVCNYQRVPYRFFQIFSLKHTTIASIQILNSSPSSEVYLNNIRLMSGSDFYFDYTETDHCFLYFNSVDMICLKAKKDYMLYNYIPIKETECKFSLSPTQTVLVPNQYTQECFETYVLMPFCKVVDPHDYTKCAECFDPNADPKRDCVCESGYFFSQLPTAYICEKCSPQCSECSISSTNCDVCAFPNATPIPECLCLYANQYTTQTSACDYCETKCSSCEILSSNCITCANGRINAPTCDCDPSSYDLSVSNSQICVPYSCEPQCSFCVQTASTCVECSANRTNPPNCDCLPGFIQSSTSNACECPPNTFEINGSCSICPSHQFYDQSLNTCSDCHNNCDQCANVSHECTACIDGSFLQNHKCLCFQTLTPMMYSQETGISECASYMQVNLSTAQGKSGFFELVFTFDAEIEGGLDLSVNEIDQVIFIYFMSVPSNAYRISGVELRQKQMILTLEFLQSFKAQGGYAQFLITNIFTSLESQTALDPVLANKTFEFQIGPLVIADSEKSISTAMLSATNTLREGGDIVYVMQQFQLCLYVVNTLQPSSIFLLLNVVVPPNLYQILQMTGLFVFPNVTDYGIVNAPIQSIDVFGHTFHVKEDYLENTSFTFRQLGFTGAILMSLPLALVLFFVWYAISLYFLIPKALGQQHGLLARSVQNTTSTKEKSKYEKVKEYVSGQIVSGNETSILLYPCAIVNQFKNVEESIFMHRWSVYVCVLLSAVMLLNLYSVYKKLFQRKPKLEKEDESIKRCEIIIYNKNNLKGKFLTHTKEVHSKEGNTSMSNNNNAFVTASVDTNGVTDSLMVSGIKEEEEIESDLYIHSEMLERFNVEQNPLSIRRYFFLQQIKKVFLVLVVVILEDFPSIVCSLVILVMLASFASSVKLRPYKKRIGNVAKILGEGGLLVVWVIYLSVFIPFNTLLDESDTISNEDISSFQTFGIVAMAAIFTLNLIYSIEFFMTNVVEKLIAWKKARQIKSQSAKGNIQQ